MTAPHRHPIAFPQITGDELECMSSLGERRRFADGDVIFREGETWLDFFVVLSGRIAVYEGSSGERKLITTHEPGEFTGDSDMFSGRPAVATGIAEGDTEVLAIPVGGMKQIVRQAPEVGDRIIQAFLTRRRMLVDSGFVGVRIVGSRYAPDTLRIREFLSKNSVPFTWTDLERDAEAGELLRRFGVQPEETPVVICESRSTLRNPSNDELAKCLGIKQPIGASIYDFVIVGAGPAGLAAAVYGASEGLRTLVVDKTGPGGQAGTSSKIENYMGFPTGLSGGELAERAVLQAEKFGAEFSVPSDVVGLECGGGFHVLKMADGSQIGAKAILIATGANYRRLNAERCQDFEGNGVYYACTAVEAMLCRDGQAIVVGGGNSAGQAAMFLSNRTAGVTLMIRGHDLSKSMSEYLASRIERSPYIELRKNAEIRKMEGNGRLEGVRVWNNRDRTEGDLDACGVFVFIGASPHTSWLPDCVATDGKGFVLTGSDAKSSGRWSQDRDPLMLETTAPGVFAAGDVRWSSVKRVASAVGEGSMTVHLVHNFLSGRV